MNNDIKPRTSDYVCADCGIKHLTAEQLAKDDHVATYHLGECGVCGTVTSITHIRTYNYMRKPKEDKK